MGPNGTFYAWEVMNGRHWIASFSDEWSAKQYLESVRSKEFPQLLDATTRRTRVQRLDNLTVKEKKGHQSK